MLEDLGDGRFKETRDDGSIVFWDHNMDRYIKKLRQFALSEHKRLFGDSGDTKDDRTPEKV